MTVYPELSTREETQLMTTPTNPPPDEGLVTQLRALGVIYAGWIRFSDDVAYFDAAVGIRPESDPLREAEVSQMLALMVQAARDGHAKLSEPDEDGFRYLRITDAGLAVLDQAVAEQAAAQRPNLGSP